MKDELTVCFQLQFCGALLPVETNDQGQDIIPLKPLVDILGLDWEKQRIRVSSHYLSRRLGICTHPMGGAGQRREMVCILVNKVASYLFTINPEQVRAQGNASSADFLEAKHDEWDNLLALYEKERGGLIVKGSKRTARKQASYDDYLKITRAKDKAQSEPEKKVLDFMARQIARDLGVPEGMEAAST